MRGFLILILICILNFPQSANAFFQKKDYKQIFLNDAANAEKRNNSKQAFHSYEGWDLDSIKHDFPNAIKYYERLVKEDPNLENQVTLANLYMANRDFEKAEKILEPICIAKPDNTKIIEAYLNTLLAQQKTKQAYCVIKTHHLETTEKGYIVFGDMAAKCGNYDAAGNNYFKALALDPENLILKNKLAQSCRALGHINAATQIYREILCKDSNNIEAKLGLGHLEIDKKNFEKSRKIFCGVLEEMPNYKFAKIGIVHSYLANGDNLKALEILKQMPQDGDIKLMEAQTYYKMGMLSDALRNIPSKRECELCDSKKIAKIKKPKKIGNIFRKLKAHLPQKTIRNKAAVETDIIEVAFENKTDVKTPESQVTPKRSEDKTNIETENFGVISRESDLYTVPGLPEHKFIIEPETAKMLSGTVSENTRDLKYQIRRMNAITLTPSYSFLIQQLADEFKLNYQRFGMEVSKNTNENANVFMQYNVYVYTSGGKLGLTNVTHEFYGGIKARPTEKDEYQATFGVKAFEFGEGAMIITDSWIKHYFNDNFNLKLGYRRNNIEQSYLSAVGEFIDGIFTGRAADNKVYLEFEGKLPHGFYSFGRGAYGLIYAQNLVTNQYSEGMIGAGKLLYNNPKNKWINTFGADIVSYNSSYQYNLLNLYNSAGVLFGGYFSPSYYNAETLNLKLEGAIKKWHLKYGIKSFGGIQTAMSPDSTTPTWGFSPYLSYELNDNVCINLAYSYYNYASVQRDLFMVNAVIRGFNKHVKS